jgi:hypothetical protein
MPGIGILIAVAFAATPPILFWGRIAFSARKRQLEIDAAEAAEQQRQRDREVSFESAAWDLSAACRL